MTRSHCASHEVHRLACRNADVSSHFSSNVSCRTTCRLSAVTPVLDRASTISAYIPSADQTYAPTERIVVGGGSPDVTLRIPQPRSTSGFGWLNESDNGICDAKRGRENRKAPVSAGGGAERFDSLAAFRGPLAVAKNPDR